MVTEPSGRPQKVGRQRGPTDPSDRSRIPWAELLLRVFRENVLTCPCGGRRVVLAYVTSPGPVKAILDHLGLPSTPTGLPGPSGRGMGRWLGRRRRPSAATAALKRRRPPVRPNPSFIPKTDSDGNDIAGVRLADVTVPLATYTGWALRSGVWANDGCQSTGQYIPFAQTLADRIASDDPRPSVEERYSSLGDYVSQVAHALNNMVRERLLLCEDYDAELNRLVEAGAAAGLQDAPGGGEPSSPRSCHARPPGGEDEE